MFNSLHEECGVFGIFENKTTYVAQSTYLALFALQHRGQESCGIAVNDDGVFNHYKGDGLVPDVFTKERLERLGMGNMAIGGTSIIIIVGVALETVKQLESQMMMRHYKGFLD